MEDTSPKGLEVLRAGLSRAVRSVHLRRRLYAQRARGAALPWLYPWVVESDGDLFVGTNLSLVLFGRLRLGRGVTLSDGACLEVGPGASLTLEDGVFVGRGTVIAAHGQLRIGAHSLLAEHCTVRDHDHHLDPDERIRESHDLVSPTQLGAKVWVGAGARILRGAQVGDGCVIAANAVVRGLVAPRSVVGGVPARLLKIL